MSEIRADTTSFRALFGRSSAVERKLRLSLRRGIRDAAKGIAEDVKDEARKPGVTGGRGGRSTGLRAGVASGVRTQIMTSAAREGVRITSSGRMAGAWQASSGWRHPLFGSRRSWYRQVGRPGYFFRTVGAGSPRVRAAVESAMREASDSLKG